MKDYLLDKQDYNEFAIDWSEGASSLNYFQSAANTRRTGALVANFIQRLQNVTDISPNTVHCIGHSLGAHTCGFVGKHLQSTKLEQISGLDPAGPGFTKNDSNSRLDPSDATLVTVEHTKAGIFTSEGPIPIELTGFIGNTANLGHYDFWPNGGAKQPGCGSIDQLAGLNVSGKGFCL